MAERITQATLDAAFGLACDAAKAAGVDTTGWILEPGSAGNGVAWRLMARPPGETHRGAVGGLGGYLGRTRADVHARLTAYREAWLIVTDQRSE